MQSSAVLFDRQRLHDNCKVSRLCGKDKTKLVHFIAADCSNKKVDVSEWNIYNPSGYIHFFLYEGRITL